MSLKGIFIALVFSCHLLFSQQGFQFAENKNRVSLDFKFINNLIIIPIEVNGTTLNFLLDTGVEDTILFSLDDTDELKLSQIEKIQIQGLGNALPIEGFKSNNNCLKIKNYSDTNHTLYLVLDQDFNISSQVGIPVNGIIGFRFFQNDIVKINYEKRKITIFKHNKDLKKIEKQYTKVPLELINQKPYINATVFLSSTDSLKTNLLIDTGNTDALWLFPEKMNHLSIPNLNYEDFLGRGFSGEVFGKRARINSISIAKFNLKNALGAFPDPLISNESKIEASRTGSVGSEILKRFQMIYDYINGFCYIKPNDNFDDPFSFNMSGVEIQHQGLQWVPQSFEENPVIANNLFDGNGEKVSNNLKYKFDLKPIYVITNVRKDSPADLAGLQKNDLIQKINNHNAYDFTLQQILELLKSDKDKIIDLEILRGQKEISIKLPINNLL